MAPLRTANEFVVNPPPDIESEYASSPAPDTDVGVWPCEADWAFSALKVAALEAVSTLMITVWIGDVEE